MEPLRREHFDRVVEDLATKDDIRELRTEMNTKFDAVLELLDVRQKVEGLERQMREVRQELDLT